MALSTIYPTNGGYNHGESEKLPFIFQVSDPKKDMNKGENGPEEQYINLHVSRVQFLTYNYVKLGQIGLETFKFYVIPCECCNF